MPEKLETMRTVANFRDVHEAHIAKGMLEAEDIPAIVIDDNMVGMNWLLSQAIGGVRVQVPEEAYDRAMEILKCQQGIVDSTPEANSPENSLEDVCPSCGSSSISPQPYSRWSIVAILLSFLAFGLPLFFGRKKWVCKDCGAAW